VPKQTKISVIGGTGNLGYGLAVRLAKANQVLIGSRDVPKAKAAAAKASKLSGATVVGTSNEAAAAGCDVAILAVPDLPSPDFLAGLAKALEGKLVISPIVPLTFKGGIASVSLSGESAAERVAKALPGSRVASAFQTVPAPVLAQLEEKMDYDVLVTADSKEVYEEAAKVVSAVGRLRPLYAGPLRISRMVEAMTPVLLNASRFNDLGTSSPSIKLV